MPVYNEEVFGPVNVDTFDDDRINKKADHPTLDLLHGSYFQLNKAINLSKKIESGMIWVNLGANDEFLILQRI